MTNRSGQSYKQITDLESKFDVIVIGSGIGGLCAAALLAKEGKRVLVAEQHYTIGGFTHVFKRKEYEWDVGLHYIGDVYDQNSILRKAFDYITDAQLDWAEMGETYDIAVFGKKEYRFVKGKQRFRAQLKHYFPSADDQASIDRYLQLLEEVERSSMGYFAAKALPSFISGMIGPFLSRSFYKYADQTTLSVLEKITGNKELIGVLTTQYGDYGLPPAKSSFFMHAFVANHYLNGGSYPVGGPSRIAQTITAVIEEHGGQVLSNAEVKNILVEEAKVKGVMMEDGKCLYAPLVISDAGIRNTFLHLLDEKIRKEHQLDKAIAELPPACAHVGLYIGLKKTAKALKLPKSNYWVFPENYDHDENQRNYRQASDPLPVSYISFPSAKDPTWEERYPGKSTIEIITLVPYEWFKAWEGSEWKNRGEEYEQFKGQIAQQLLESLFRVLPQLREEVDYYELSTPLTTRKFDHNDKGEIYGLAHSPARFRNKNLKPQTPVKGLYLTGQDVLTAGIGGALMGGVLCVSAILRKNMLNKIRR